MSDRLPQRFRYRKTPTAAWTYGIVMPGKSLWHIQAGYGHGSFEDDPWEMMGMIIGNPQEFQWIDNDYGWAGDVMPRPCCESCGATVPAQDLDEVGFCNHCAIHADH